MGDGGLAMGWTTLRASATHFTMQSTYLTLMDSNKTEVIARCRRAGASSCSAWSSEASIVPRVGPIVGSYPSFVGLRGSSKSASSQARN